MGTILLAHEGINGTIAGPDAGIESVLGWLRAKPEFAGLDVKFSLAEEPPFLRMKVRLKKEIVTLGAPEVDATNDAGTYVSPENWNELINDPDVIVVDTRNEYEVAIGTFKGAENPGTTSFRELPKWVDEHLDAARETKIAMFCTGGIRCEKSTALLKSKGYENLFHLQGGILKYLEKIPEEESLWEGECFVFDQRVSVKHGLIPGKYDLCHACRMPIDAHEKARFEYQPGISCHYCYNSADEKQRERYTERQRQIELAKDRDEPHLAIDLKEAKARKRAEKELQKIRSRDGAAKKSSA